MSIGWMIFWGVIVLWIAVGIKRMPIYYKRHFEKQVESWESYRVEEKRRQEWHKEAAWTSLGLAFIWGWYEICLFYRNAMINHMTREERELEEYEKAQQIVADWEAKKKAEFERQLNGG